MPVDLNSFLELIEKLGSKKRDIVEETKQYLTDNVIKINETLIEKQVTQKDIFEGMLNKTTSDNRPNVICGTCDLLRIIIESNKWLYQTYYYMIIPAISPLCLDVKKNILESSRACIECIYGSVVNKDLQELIPDLISSIYDPDLTESTIDKVASTKFVTQVNAGTISILCPLLLRGYGMRKDKISRLCSIIIVNMLKLVEEYKDVENFLPVLTPPVMVAADSTSDPEARDMIQKSLKELDRIKGLKDTSTSIKSEKPDGAVELCNCDFTLAYGNKILLKNTNMTLYKGYKYGLIGESGKSTLLSAISENKVDGFPDTNQVKCVFVRPDIIGEISHLNCIDYVLEDPKIKAMNLTSDAVVQELLNFGFGNEQVNPNSAAQVNHGVSTLSGGWRIKLALARAMLVNPDILLLESPTDHLDTENIEWIENYIKDSDKTIVFTSQSKVNLNKCCTHIIQIKNLKLNIFYGNLDELIKRDPDVEEYFKLVKTEGNELKFTFPAPGVLDGVKSKTKALIKMQNCTFTYPGNSKPTIEDISMQVSLSSRIGCIGKNGNGKSTGIKLLTGENIPQVGEVYKHPSVRLGYIAQHSFETLDLHPDKTPNEYIRWRFERPGEDREAIKKQTTTLNEQEEEEMKKSYTFTITDDNDKLIKVSGVVDSLTGLRKKLKDGSFSYQIKWAGKSDDSNTYIPLVQLEKVNEVCFRKLVNAVDEKIASLQGLYIKPLTRKNVEDHLKSIGLEPELASHTKLCQLSDSEKVRVVIGATFWLQPHILIGDEVSNCMTHDCLVAFLNGLKEFEGGVVLISHNQDLIDEACNEIWLMSKDPVTGIGHLTVSGGETSDMKQIFQEKSKLDIEDTYTDATGNTVKIIKRKKATKQDLKKIKKKIAALRKAGEEVYTDEFLEKEGFEL